MNDITGEKLYIDDVVAYSDKDWSKGQHSVCLGKVVKFGKKMVVIKLTRKVGESTFAYRSNRYPQDIVKINNGGSNELSE